MWHYTRSEAGTLTKNKRMVMNWYSFLRHEYSFFNATVSRLITLKTLKSQKKLGLGPQKAHQGSALDPKLQKQSFCKHFLRCKTQLTLVKVLG